MMKISKKIIACSLVVLISICPFQKRAVLASEISESLKTSDFIRFVGDIYIANHTRNAYDKNGIDGIIDEKYKKLCIESDICVGNLECVICDGANAVANKQFNLFAPKKYAKPLKDIGFDVFCLANNHILDFGIDALNDTVKVLKEHGIESVGAGKDRDEAMKCYFKEVGDKKYALLSASIVIPEESWKATDTHAGINNGFEIKNIGNEIKNLKSRMDKVIVYMHWGNEKETHSNAHQRSAAHALVNYGADLVVGCHSHMPQEIEYYNGTPIVYGLGNFIFGSTMREMMMLEASVDYSTNDKGDIKLRIYPGMSGYEKVYAYWKPDEIAAKCKEISDRSTNCFIDDEGYVHRGE